MPAGVRGATVGAALSAPTGDGEVLAWDAAVQVTAIGQPLEPVAPLIGVGGKMNAN